MSNPFSGKKILIVDDTPGNIQTLAALLEGAKKIVALDGEKALELAKKSPAPDLILLDIQMPKMDGYEVCQNLRSSDITKDIPIIFISANSESDEIEKGLKMGAQGYISKPIEPTKLFEEIERILS